MIEKDEQSKGLAWKLWCCVGGEVKQVNLIWSIKVRPHTMNGRPHLAWRPMTIGSTIQIPVEFLRNLGQCFLQEFPNPNLGFCPGSIIIVALITAVHNFVVMCRLGA